MNLSTMPLVHHARRLIEERANGNPFVTDAVLATIASDLEVAYLTEERADIARLLKVELDRVETIH